MPNNDPSVLKFEVETDSAKLAEFRQVVDDLFNRFGLGGQQTEELRARMVAAWSEIRLSTDEARQAAALLEPELRAQAEATRDVGSASGGADVTIKGLSKNFLGMVSVAGLLIANLRDLRKELGPAVDVLKGMAVESGASQTAVDLFSNSIEAMLNPTKIAENLIANFKIGWDEFAKGTGLASTTLDALSDDVRRVNDLILEHQKTIEQDAQKLQDRTDAMAIQVRAEKARGEVTAQTREELEKLVKVYDKGGRSIPPKIDAARRELEILTEAEKEAAEAAKKRGEEQERASDKAAQAAERAAEKTRQAIRSEVEAIEGSADALAERTEILEAAIATAEEDGTVTTEAQESIRKKLVDLLADYKRLGAEAPESLQQLAEAYGALGVATESAAADQAALAAAAREVREALEEQTEAAKVAAKETADALAAAAKDTGSTESRIRDLEGKSVRTLDEEQELFDLRGKLFNQQQELREAEREHEETTLALEEAQRVLAEAVEGGTTAMAGALGPGADYARLEAEIAKQSKIIADTAGAQAEALGTTREELERGVDAGGAFRGTMEEAAAALRGQNAELEHGGELVGEFGAGMSDAAGDAEQLEGALEAVAEAGSEAGQTLAEQGEAVAAGWELANAQLDAHKQRVEELLGLYAELNTALQDVIGRTAELNGTLD